VTVISPTILKRREFESVAWHITLQPHVAWKDLLDPKAWQHHAGTMKRGDTVFARAEDFSYVGELIVFDVEAGFVVMDELWVKHFPERAAATEASAAVEAERKKYSDPPTELPGLHFTKSGWRLIGYDNKEVAKFPTKERADAALADYVKRSTKTKAA
jgi:hypothetical protein